LCREQGRGKRDKDEGGRVKDERTMEEGRKGRGMRDEAGSHGSVFHSIIQKTKTGN